MALQILAVIYNKQSQHCVCHDAVLLIVVPLCLAHNKRRSKFSMQERIQVPIKLVYSQF